jgi:hypothetical protein
MYIFYLSLFPPQGFEFAVPPGSDLTFSPHVGEVPPQSRLRVQVATGDGDRTGADDLFGVTRLSQAKAKALCGLD